MRAWSSRGTNAASSRLTVSVAASWCTRPRRTSSVSRLRGWTSRVTLCASASKLGARTLTGQLARLAAAIAQLAVGLPAREQLCRRRRAVGQGRRLLERQPCHLAPCQPGRRRDAADVACASARLGLARRLHEGLLEQFLHHREGHTARNGQPGQRAEQLRDRPRQRGIDSRITAGGGAAGGHDTILVCDWHIRQRIHHEIRPATTVAGSWPAAGSSRSSA